MVQERRKSSRRGEDQERDRMINQAIETANKAMNAVSTHEMLCAQRQQALLDRLKRVEGVIYAAMCGIIAIWATSQFLHN